MNKPLELSHYYCQKCGYSSNPLWSKQDEQKDFNMLDVGCGSNPVGDVNCDLFVKETIHRADSKTKTMNPHGTSNFVKCDANHLPFKDKAFVTVHSKSLLEHVTSPTKVLKEKLRVAKERVVFSVPHYYSRLRWFPWYKQLKSHKHFFSTGQLRAWLNKIVPSKSYEITLEWRALPNYEPEWLPFLHFTLLRIPWKINVRINK